MMPPKPFRALERGEGLWTYSSRNTSNGAPGSRPYRRTSPAQPAGFVLAAYIPGPSRAERAASSQLPAS
jgi:hypothetical protein